MQPRSAGALGSAASQRVIETVIAPEHVLAHEECGRTEYSLGSGEFSLIAQPQLVALVLGGIALITLAPLFRRRPA